MNGISKSLLAAAVLSLTVMAWSEGSSGPRDEKRTYALRFRIANFEDLQKSMSARRQDVRGVWARICLTKEIMVTELEIARLKEVLTGIQGADEKAEKRAAPKEPVEPPRPRGVIRSSR